ncbi:glycosyltransferase family 4 protein [Desulfonatronum thiosulfatophilum]|nr:glycosyltransferase family 4 protein [Desulfonatronum thiosulfatophilum]
MVLKGYPRISETFISNEIRLLEELGFRIHIFSMRRPRESFSHASVKQIRAPVTYLPESLFWGLGRLAKANVRLFRTDPQAFRRGLDLMRSRYFGAPKKHTWLKHFLQAGSLVLKMRTDSDAGRFAHVHAHFAHTPSSVALYAATMAGLPFSFTAHAKDIYTQGPGRLLEKMRRARFVITCTDFNRRHLEGLKANSDIQLPVRTPVHTVYHGIDLALFTAPRRSAHASAPYSILTVARLVEKKGLPTILKALALLKDKGLDFVHTLVGSGSDQRKVEVMIRDLGLGERVRLVGTITHDDVITLYGGADLFVLGCRQARNGDRDGIPNVVAEAMATGVPVAATDISGVPELVEHEKTGLLSPCDNPVALAANMERLLVDQSLRARIIPAARSKVEAVFDNRILARKLAEIYLHESGLKSRPESWRSAP